MPLQFVAFDAQGNEYEIVHVPGPMIQMATRGGVRDAGRGHGRLKVADTGQSVNRLAGRGKMEIVRRPKIPITTNDPLALAQLWPQPESH